MEVLKIALQDNFITPNPRVLLRSLCPYSKRKVLYYYRCSHNYTEMIGGGQ